ncbi:MAG: thermonuclease family protein [Thiobacillus sp.]|uniref:thermonuclease family protein n=1 Tax=Thiobacillus sp. TaxID=924 RepID=UPI0027357924|nr:thermonuclease family protein [Thiobacillus sp.]MDP3584626.1 thermonuclease family protein [Thiobacillus sp.]
MRCLLAAWLLFASAAWADTLQGVVIVVIDGDTVLFKPDHYASSSRAFLKVRLAGIDAPEAAQPHGDAATRALKEMALKQRATLEIVATDHYGRKLGRLSVGTLAVNAELVRRGHAWSYGSPRASARRGPDPVRTGPRAAGDALSALQNEAQHARRGLWRDAAPVPPWAWRRTQATPAY